MRSGRELVKLDIVSVDKGRKLGTVKDVYLGPSLERVSALYLGTEGGLFNRTPCLIPFDKVTRLGNDVVLVENAEVVCEVEQYPEAQLWTRRDDLRGRSVNTAGGTRIGLVDDVVVDDEAQVLGYKLSPIYVEGPLAQRGIIPRSAVTDFGHNNRVMTVDLQKAEQEQMDLG